MTIAAKAALLKMDQSVKPDGKVNSYPALDNDTRIDIIYAIEQGLQRGYLKQRQIDILVLYCQGYTENEIEIQFGYTNISEQLSGALAYIGEQTGLTDEMIQDAPESVINVVLNDYTQTFDYAPIEEVQIRKERIY